MDSTVPADLLKLKARLEAWRATRKYARQPIPDEFRQAAADMTERHPLSLVRRVLKLDPWRMKKPATKKSDRVCHKPQTAFFTLPPEPTLLLPGSSTPLNLAGCRLQIERPDGSRLTLTLPYHHIFTRAHAIQSTCLDRHVSIKLCRIAEVVSL